MRVQSFFAGFMIAAGISAGIATLYTQPTSAMGIAHCAGVNGSGLGTGLFGDSGTRQIDPIVSRGSAMSMHEHQFFGFTEWDTMATPYSANYADLANKKTSCDIKGDSAAYWTPSMRYKTPTTDLVKIKRQEAYYRSWNGKLTDTAKATRPFPMDLRMVAGNGAAMSKADWKSSIVAWSCGNLSTKAQRTGTKAETPVEADCSTATNYNDPTKTDRVFLTVSVKFPTCWDGKKNDHLIDGDTSDFNGSMSATNVQHVVYRTSAGCPAKYPIKLPELTVVTSWDYRGNGQDIAVSSGMGEAAGQGYTYHTDFMNTWNQTSLENMIATCINTSETDAAVHKKYPTICGPTIIMTPPRATN